LSALSGEIRRNFWVGGKIQVRKSAEDIPVALIRLPRPPVWACDQKCIAIFCAVGVVKFVGTDFRSGWTEKGILLCGECDIAKPAQALSHVCGAVQQLCHGIGLPVCIAQFLLKVQKSAALGKNGNSAGSMAPEVMQK